MFCKRPTQYYIIHTQISPYIGIKRPCILIKTLEFNKVFLYICIKEYFQNKMTYRDFVTPPTDIPCEKWQLGSLITNEPQSGGVALLFVTDYRGNGNGGEVMPTDFHLLGSVFIRFLGKIIHYPLQIWEN